MGTGAQQLITAPPHAGAARVDTLFPGLSCSCVFYLFFNLLLQDAFCRGVAVGLGLGTICLFPPPGPLQPPQAPQWAELGSLTEASMALTVRRQRERVPEEGDPEKVTTELTQSHSYRYQSIVSKILFKYIIDILLRYCP